MGWLGFAFLTIIFYAIFDFFLKLSSERIHGGLGGFLINFTAAIVLLVFIAIAKIKGEQIPLPRSGGVLYSLLAGLAIGMATIFFMKMFAVGVNLSIGIPLVRIGIVLLASLIGVFILKEDITLKYVAGFILALVGLYLLIAR